MALKLEWHTIVVSSILLFLVIYLFITFTTIFNLESNSSYLL